MSGGVLALPFLRHGDGETAGEWGVHNSQIRTGVAEWMHDERLEPGTPCGNAFTPMTQNLRAGVDVSAETRVPT